MESPKPTANSRIGWVASSAPWLVVARAGPARWPSWKISTRIPNTALRLSAFISTALIGSTTEPVIRNRTISVVATTTASTARQVRAEAVLEVDVGRGLAGHADVERRVERADVVDELLAVGAERARTGATAISEQRRCPPAGPGATADTSGRRPICAVERA